MAEPIIKSERPYFRRSPVAKFFKVGNMTVNGIQRTLWGFMSFHNGVGKLPTFAAFGGLAPVDEHGHLRIEGLKDGVIIVAPGIIYNPIPPLDVTGKMMAEHDKAMKKWKPKAQLVTERSDAPAVDMGVIHMPGTGSIQ
jgi:hypothetical protein